MKRTSLFLIFSVVSFCSFAQSKLDHVLSEYAINIDVDSNYWRRVTSKELSGRSNHSKSYDEFLNEQRHTAQFFYIPKDSIGYPPTTFITIDVFPVDQSAGSIYNRSDSSINSNNFDSFLSKISGGNIDRGFGKTFKDEYTGTVLYKFLTYMSFPKNEGSVFRNYVSLPRHFLIGQTKLIKDKVVAVEYHCYQDQQQDYFPRFEKIIRSFQ